MPELPEVQTVLNTLEGMIKDDEIIDIEILYPNIIVGNIEEFKKRLIGQHFRKFMRRGKYLLFRMDDCFLVSHLRMEGKYFYKKEGEEFNKHSHIIFHLSDNHQLEYNDVRKFGRMDVLELDTDFSHFKNLGVEPFDEGLDLDYVKSYLHDENRPIKEILLDQSFVAGIGNIYADEIIFNTLVHPLTKGKYLDEKTILKLIDNIKLILSEAIQMGGTTIRSYTSSLGVTGRFQLQLSVHQKEGKPCPICETTIKKFKVGGRGTYYCPNCQKLTRRIGITGSIGSGKSLALKHLKDLGYKTFSADEEVSRLYEAGNKGYLILKEIHPELFDGDNLNKLKMSELLFNDGSFKQEIENLIHPLVLDAYLAMSINEDIVFCEIPLMYEAGFDKYFDEILVISTKEKEIYRRLKNRSYSKAEISKRLNNQMDIKLKIAKADRHINNDKTIAELYDKIDMWVEEVYARKELL